MGISTQGEIEKQMESSSESRANQPILREPAYRRGGKGSGKTHLGVEK